MTGDGVVEVSVHIAAQPETVFGYFTDPGRYQDGRQCAGLEAGGEGGRT